MCQDERAQLYFQASEEAIWNRPTWKQLAKWAARLAHQFYQALRRRKKCWECWKNTREVPLECFCKKAELTFRWSLTWRSAQKSSKRIKSLHAAYVIRYTILWGKLDKIYWALSFRVSSLNFAVSLIKDYVCNAMSRTKGTSEMQFHLFFTGWECCRQRRGDETETWWGCHQKWNKSLEAMHVWR